VIYAKAFFDLQVAFAQTVTTLSRLPLSRVLLDYTNLYRRFGLGRAFDATQPVWLDYLSGLRAATDVGDWTYGFYVARGGEPPGPPVVATFGCFSYARLGEDRIRLHFKNVEASGVSPLGREHSGRRMAELAALFEHVSRTVRQSVGVVGASWLYNVEAYRRLFPASYLATARVMTGRFQHMPLWGQFLDRHGAVKERMSRPFRERLARQSAMGDLDRCFPLPVLSLEASVQHFYDLYDISASISVSRPV
jgi:hypothetical protein